MTKPKKDEPEEELSPLEKELAESAIPEDRPAPEPTVDEVAAASIFTTDADQPPAGAAPQIAVPSADLLADLEKQRAKSHEYLDGWQRSRAEFANYKRRIEREQEEGRGRAMAAVLTKVLPAVDDLERALRDRPNSEEVRAWTEGIELIYRKLTGLLESEGVETIPAEGAMFDPALHEAVTHEVSSDHEHGQIIEVIQQGYRLGDRVLRPVRVRVAK